MIDKEEDEQEDIYFVDYEKFRKEFKEVKENLDDFLLCLVEDPETYEQLYPNYTNHLKNKLYYSSPTNLIMSINNCLRAFEYYKEEVFHLSGIQKINKIEDAINTLSMFFTYNKQSEREKNFIKLKETEINKQLSYWKEQLYQAKLTVPKELTERFEDSIYKSGFYELDKVNILKPHLKTKLIDKLKSSDLAFSIAMLDYLGFFKYLENIHNTQREINLIVTRIFNANAKDETNVKKLRYSLVKADTKGRYKANEYIEEVERFYKELK